MLRLKAVYGLSALSFLFALFLTTPLPAEASPSTIRSTELGLVEGFLSDGTIAFLGIPYASPPLGSLRWRAPQAAQPWNGVREASAFPPPCINKKSLEDGSEDCLYLNIWVPEGVTPSDKLPVFFYIHGGAYESGSSTNNIPFTQTKMFRGAYLAERNDVIVVTIQYRLGALGFLSHPYLDARQNGTSGNYGSKDMLFALQWVKRNIASFGGNEEKIMLVGESAGSWGVCSLLLAPQAAGLFHAAALQSGPCLEHSRLRASLVAETLGEAMNCSDLSCLESKTAADIVSSYESIESEELITLNVYGTDIRPLPVLDAIESGNYNKIPLVIGSNKWEFGLPSKTDKAIGCGVQRLALAFAEAQNQAVYRYLYTHIALFGVPAAHGTELPFLFATIEDTVFNLGNNDAAMISLLQAYWTNAAKNKNVNRFALPHWPRLNPNTKNYLELDSSPRVRFGDTVFSPESCGDHLISIPDSVF